jgi:hypothetical protein
MNNLHLPKTYAKGDILVAKTKFVCTLGHVEKNDIAYVLSVRREDRKVYDLMCLLFRGRVVRGLCPEPEAWEFDWTVL